MKWKKEEGEILGENTWHLESKAAGCLSSSHLFKAELMQHGGKHAPATKCQTDNVVCKSYK